MRGYYTFVSTFFWNNNALVTYKKCLFFPSQQLHFVVEVHTQGPTISLFVLRLSECEGWRNSGHGMWVSNWMYCLSLAERWVCAKLLNLNSFLFLKFEIIKKANLCQLSLLITALSHILLEISSILFDFQLGLLQNWYGTLIPW